MGRKPIVVIADPDILRQVMVKEFSSFPNRLVRATPSGNHVLHAPQSVFWRPTCVCLRRNLLLPASQCLTACSSWEMTHGRGCAASWPRPSARPKWRRWDVNVSVNMRIFTTGSPCLALASWRVKKRNINIFRNVASFETLFLASLTSACVSSAVPQMVPLINTASDVLMTNLSVYAESGESFDIYK